ncbi:ROK family protein [Sphingomonas sp. H39-1-10]|uniref:ROK family protein n=1 Tax=Sphingomonas pollutisoli TaxID=3030829 RepID=UPI0023B9D98E|nr:ROK family protein [Sphingomonas pollutisoli]MDF0490163.1 ROK family protein [Sphingomonas pollutisoli]
MRPQPEIQLADEQKRLIHLLRAEAPRSRIEISRLLNINNGVVTRLSRELISLGLVSEAGAQATPRGRPTLPLSLRADGAYAIGLATHPGRVDICVLDFGGTPLAQHSVRWDEGEPEQFARMVAQEVEAITAPLRLRHSRFLGYGVSVPGFSIGSQAKRHTVERMRSWRDVDLSHLLGEILGGPVWIDNDANAAAVAEYYDDGSATGASMLVLFLGHGVGGGCVVAGQLFSGEHGNAGEIGILYPLDQPRPSAIDLARLLQSEEGNPIDLFNLASCIDRHPETVQTWVARAAQQLGLAVLSGIGWFDPATIVLAGVLPAHVLEALAAQLNSVDWAKKLGRSDTPAIRASRLQGQAGAIGAAFLPIHHMLAPETGFGLQRQL